jgi:hypothetical protein
MTSPRNGSGVTTTTRMMGTPAVAKCAPHPFPRPGSDYGALLESERSRHGIAACFFNTLSDYRYMSLSRVGGSTDRELVAWKVSEDLSCDAGGVLALRIDFDPKVRLGEGAKSEPLGEFIVRPLCGRGEGNLRQIPRYFQPGWRLRTQAPARELSASWPKAGPVE